MSPSDQPGSRGRTRAHGRVINRGTISRYQAGRWARVCTDRVVVYKRLRTGRFVNDEALETAAIIRCIEQPWATTFVPEELIKIVLSGYRLRDADGNALNRGSSGFSRMPSYRIQRILETRGNLGLILIIPSFQVETNFVQTLQRVIDRSEDDDGFGLRIFWNILTTRKVPKNIGKLECFNIRGPF